MTLLVKICGLSTRETLDAELALAERAGFRAAEEPLHRRSHGAILEKPPGMQGLPRGAGR